MSSKRSMSAGQAVASPRWAAPTSAAQRSRSSTSVITREEPAPAVRLPHHASGQRPPDGGGPGAERLGWIVRTVAAGHGWRAPARDAGADPNGIAHVPRKGRRAVVSGPGRVATKAPSSDIRCTTRSRPTDSYASCVQPSRPVRGWSSCSSNRSTWAR